MAWYRVGGGGLPPQIKTDMNNVLNKKMGTSGQTYPPSEWASDVNLMGMLEEKTIVSSPIADFSDGADDVPTKSLVVTIPPTLSGVSSVTETQTGRNLLPNKSYLVGANTLWLGDDSSPYYQPLKAGTYTVSLDTSETMTILLYENGSWIDRKYNATTATFVMDHDGSFAIQLYKSTGIPVINNWQLEIGNQQTAHVPYTTPTTYTASLGRTIYGGQVDVVKGEGSTKVHKQTYTGDNVGTVSLAYGQADEGYTHLYFNIADIPLAYNPTSDNVISNISLPWNNNASTAGIPSVGECWRLTNGGSPQKPIIYMYIHQTWASVADFKTWLNANPIMVVYEVADETDFTFTGQEIPTRLGYNAFWSEQGDTEVTYRASGTVTPIQPTLISKAITANGIYTASDDDVDGYDTVEVNVASPEPTVTPLNSPNAFLSQSGVSGTDVTRTVRTETAPSDGKYVFAADSTCRTNTESGDGFIDIQKNGVSVVKQYMEANTTTSITIPDIEVVTGDEVSIVVGFDNAHSYCNFQLYTGIAFVSEASASLLSMMPSEEVNDNEEVEENEPYR